MKRAYSVDNIKNAKFNTLDFTGKWLAAIGRPQLTGSWFIFGDPKNGKTTFALKLAKYLTDFERIYYNPVEEGFSLSMQMAVERVELVDRFVMTDPETVPEMIERLDKHKSPNVVFLDSVQFADLKFSEYKELKTRYPGKLFVFISHTQGKIPDGGVARRIWRDAAVVFNVEGFRAFCVSRFGGGESIDIDEQLAAEYWGLK